jgi:co-chaperonin GroES (HSP10)
MEFKPLGNRVIVKDTDRPEVTEGGIYVGSAKADSSTKNATVVAVGPDTKDVKVGDVIYLDWTKIRTVKDGDTVYGVIDEEHVLAVLED